jgi:hypothetical protein
VPNKAIDPREDVAGQIAAPAKIQDVEALLLWTFVKAGSAQSSDYLGSIHTAAT